MEEEAVDDLFALAADDKADGDFEAVDDDNSLPLDDEDEAPVVVALEAPVVVAVEEEDPVVVCALADDKADDEGDFATTHIIEAVDNCNNGDSASGSMTLQNFNLTTSPTAVWLTLLPS